MSNALLIRGAAPILWLSNDSSTPFLLSETVSLTEPPRGDGWKHVKQSEVLSAQRDTALAQASNK